jgi:lactoylglutathione lyase
MLWYLGYVVLFADDFEKTVEFYTTQVGLPLRLRAEGYVEFAIEGAKFALLSRARAIQMAGPAYAGKPQTGTHEGAVTILVDDVDRTYRELGARGVPFLGAPQDRPWGQRTCLFQDPEGHLIEIATNLPRTERPGV